MNTDQQQGLEISDDLHRFSTDAHAHLMAMPAALDVKISILTAVMVGVLIFGLRGFGEHYVHGHVLAALDLSGWLWIAGILALLAGIGAGAFALHHHAHGSHDNAFSVHGFAAHANGAAMLAALKEKTPQQLLEDRLLHCREVAIISVLKGRWFHRALICGLAGVVLVGQGVIF